MEMLVALKMVLAGLLAVNMDQENVKETLSKLVL